MSLIKKPTAIVVLTGMVLVSGCIGQSEPAQSPAAPSQPEQIRQAGEVKEFRVKASQWKFEPDTITANKGDRVRIIAESLDVPHGFAIDEYGISLYLSPGEQKTAEFTADRAGTFTFYCNVPCGRGHGGMNGRLVVEE